VDCWLSICFSLLQQCDLIILVIQDLTQPDFEAMTTLLMIALSQLQHSISANPKWQSPQILVDQSVHKVWFQYVTLLIRIVLSIAWYHVRQWDRSNLNLELSISIFSSWIISQLYSAASYCKFMSHHIGNLACVIDSSSNQPILCQGRISCISSNFESSQTVQCILTETNE